MDINSLIANYLKNTNNTEVNASQIKDAFYNLASEDLQFCDSIFVYGEDATKDELIEYMSKACGKDDDQFKEDVGLLFDVLNSNSDDDVLTADELENFTRQRGENQGKIDGFGIWNELLNADVSKIESELGGSENSGDIEAEVEEGEDSGATDDGFSNEYINRIAQSIYDGTTTLEQIIETNLLTDEEIALLEEAIEALENGDELPSTEEGTTPEPTTPEGTTPEATTPEATTPEATTPEATTPEATTPDGTTPEATNPQDPDSGSTLSNEDAALYASQLQDAMKGGFFFGLGTDDEQFASIMDNENLTSADWVKIIKSYNEQYGSFIKDVDDDFSGETQDKYQAKIANVLLEAAENGDSEAIDLLCEEFYNGTAGQWLTADEFVATIFENASDEVLAQMARRYNSVTGSDIFKDIKGDFSFGTEDSYIARINEAIINSR